MMSFLLVITMLIFSIIPCGPNAPEFYNLAKELSQKGIYQIDSRTTLQISNVEEIQRKDYEAEIANYAEGTSVPVFKYETIPEGFDKISFAINGHYGNNTANLDTKMLFSDNTSVNVKIIEKDGTTYFSKDILNLAYKIGEDVNPTALKNVESKINAYNYLYIVNDNVKETLTENTDFSLENLEIMKNFDNGLLTKVDENTYKYTLKLEQIPDLMKKVVDYFSNNTEMIKEAFGEEVNLTNLLTYNDSGNALVKDISGSEVSFELKKLDNNTYSITVNIILNKYGYEMVNIHSESIINRTNLEYVTIDMNSIKAISFKTVKEYYDTEMCKLLNPDTIKINWWADKNDEFEIEVFSSIAPENKYLLNTEYHARSGRIYLPLRFICESFGEIVEWDTTTKQAAIRRQEALIPMFGENVNGRTYIKIRDFEALEYTVDYKEYQGSTYREAVITKNF